MAPSPLSEPSATLLDWVGFHLLLAILLGVELLYARRQVRAGRSQRRTAVAATLIWTFAALAFAGFVRSRLGATAAVQYVAGYALEQSLSIDNLFVFLLLFRTFGIERSRQPKVLFWGVTGAIVLRGVFVLGGLRLLARFEPVTYVFGFILLIAAVRIFFGDSASSDATDPGHGPRWLAWLKRLHPVSERQDAFVVRENGRPMVTVLLLSLIAIELTDVFFALDSIPAVLSITRHPYLAYTSNIMAVMGLRSLYFLIIGVLSRLRLLHYGLAVLLAFAAVKMLASRWVEIGPLSSLVVILVVLSVTIAGSLVPAREVGKL